MRVLAFDTAMPACSVAVVECGGAGAEILAHRFEPRARGHAEVLMDQIAETMSDAGVGYSDLDRLAVTTGPGTFTGVRIGVAAARGMALGTGLPLVGVTTLEALAAAGAGLTGGSVAAAIDARRGEVYVQCFSNDLTPLSEPCVVTPADAADVLRGHTPLIVGTGARIMRDVCGEAAGFTFDAAAPELSDACHVACRGAVKPSDGPPPSPFYLRAPDAKLPQRKDG